MQPLYRPYTTMSDLHKGRTNSLSSNLPPPEEAVRTIIAAAIAPARLPPTDRFESHYIRGLTDDGTVAFRPEFLFMLAAGMSSIAGVSLLYNAIGLGDPTFPDFSEHRLFAVTDWTSNEIIFPSSAGSLLVTTDSSIPPEEVARRLKDLVRAVHHIGGTLYSAEVVPFSEKRIAAQVGALPFVRSVELNRIVRIIDGIRWVENRVS
jgi:hypothetical protein